MKEYFWEYEYKFGQFLKRIFPNTYQRKYSLTGNGIYNLILVNGKVYEVKFSQTTRKLIDNDKMTTDQLKNKIINNILSNLKNEYTINNGKVTFKLDKFIAKIEVVRKIKMPE